MNRSSIEAVLLIIVALANSGGCFYLTLRCAVFGRFTIYETNPGILFGELMFSILSLSVVLYSFARFLKIEAEKNETINYRKSARYQCSKCGRWHFKGSKIGKEHWEYRDGIIDYSKYESLR